ncbi:MAG: hypothetical protein MK135_15950, partial [Polyangiaceae bacterium]|nr:hypothetical protein [Polyangiaceae bacterium]
IVLILTVLLLGLGYYLGSPVPIATLEAAQGNPERDHAESMNHWEKADLSDKFFEGDGARTFEKQEAEFQLFSGERLLLKPQSQIRFLRQGKDQGIGLNVELGEVDIQTGGQELMLESEFGELVVEANSQFTLTKSAEGKLRVAVRLGTLEFTEQGQRLEAGETVDVTLGGLEFEEEPAEEPLDDSESEPEEVNQPEALFAADLWFIPGQTFTVHDPRPPSAVGVRTPLDCPEGVILRAGNQVSEGKRSAGLRLSSGRYQYQVACLQSPTNTIAEGVIRVTRDSGQRPLPQYTPQANVVTDGRKYTVLYHHRLPRVKISWPTAPQADAFTVKVDGRSYKSRQSSFSLKAGALGAGTHKIVYSAESQPPRRSRTTILKIKYDAQAPKARVSSPPASGFQAGSNVPVKGQALAGWTVSMNGEALELDRQRRFASTFEGSGQLALRFSHPRQGVHYFLRRAR